MARRRVKNPVPLRVLRAAHEARVRHTAGKVAEGKVVIADVEADIRNEVDVKVKLKLKRGP